ncbi:unnamed protein product [Microthlaspi erraticum]|uniref:Arabidopsis retrotransposon Orf1 C-terminal domain-containing protein n=1 Tax=Microthlaspi erraticum TaxID=1685480 RepID=A0A6D2KUM1_9BRAS|nr:unnamed protein product [Microthlaspi erraticum]
MRYHNMMSSIELSWTKAGDGSRSWQREKGRWSPLGSLRYCLGSLWRRELIGTSRKMSSKVFGLQSLKGVLFFKVQGCSDRSLCLRYVHKALANTFFARKGHWTINEGEVKLLDMGNQAHHLTHKMGRRSEEIGHAGNLMPLLDQLLSYKHHSYNTRFNKGGSLVLEDHTNPMCSWGPIRQEKVNSSWMDGHQVLQDQPPH